MSSDKKLAVFTVVPWKSDSKWIRIGSAWTNRDGSLNVYLDALPLDGKLHVREVTASVDLGLSVRADGEVTR